MKWRDCSDVIERLDFVGFNAVKMLFYSAVLNGVLAPPLIVLVVLLTSKREVMGTRVSSRPLRYLGWTTAGVMSAAARRDVCDYVEQLRINLKPTAKVRESTPSRVRAKRVMKKGEEDGVEKEKRDWHGVLHAGGSGA